MSSSSPSVREYFTNRLNFTVEFEILSVESANLILNHLEYHGVLGLSDSLLRIFLDSDSNIDKFILGVSSCDGGVTRLGSHEVSSLKQVLYVFLKGYNKLSTDRKRSESFTSNFHYQTPPRKSSLEFITEIPIHQQNQLSNNEFSLKSKFEEADLSISSSLGREKRRFLLQKENRLPLITAAAVKMEEPDVCSKIHNDLCTSSFIPTTTSSTSYISTPLSEEMMQEPNFIALCRRHRDEDLLKHEESQHFLKTDSKYHELFAYLLKNYSATVQNHKTAPPPEDFRVLKFDYIESVEQENENYEESVKWYTGSAIVYDKIEFKFEEPAIRFDTTYEFREGISAHILEHISKNSGFVA